MRLRSERSAEPLETKESDFVKFLDLPDVEGSAFGRCICHGASPRR